jgi:hypothetical protein
MKKLIFLFSFYTVSNCSAQELYVFSEPASNMPANSIGLKFSAQSGFEKNLAGNLSNRFMAEIMAGITKNWMAHIFYTFGNIHTRSNSNEASGFYLKYRFLSFDEIHQHFRMAAFITASKSNSPFQYDEINLEGDKSGIEGGIIATQLWNRFALSGTVSHSQVFDSSRNSNAISVPALNYQAMNYSLSGGLLVLPAEYTDYKQTNLNIYLELLAQQTLDRPAYYIDMAPAIQLIFNSNAKLNIGYRFQLGGNMSRINRDNWMVSFERTFLNAFKRRKQD